MNASYFYKDTRNVAPRNSTGTVSVGGTRYCRNCTQPFSETTRMRQFIAASPGVAWDALSDEAGTCSRDCTTTLRAETGILF